MTDPLEKLANEGREHEESQRLALDKYQSTLEKRQSGDDVLDEALGGGFAWPLWVAFVLGVPAAVITIGVVLDLNVAFVNIGWVLILSGGCLLLYWLGNRWHRSQQRQWLARFPFPFDREKYLANLRQKRGMVTVRVRVSLAQPVPEDARALVSKAMIGAVETQGWMGDGTKSTVSFAGNDVMIKSGGIHGHFGTTTQDSQRPAHHSNRQFHRWFRLLADRGLVALHARYRISNVDISF